MPRRRRRRNSVRPVTSVARASARAVAHPPPVLPPGLPRSERAKYERLFRRYERRYAKALGRGLNRSEKDEVRREVVDYIRQQKSILNRRFHQAMKGVEAPTIRHRRIPELLYGKGRTGTGSTGLHGSLKRRIKRAGPRRFVLRKPKWIDPYPWIPGTRPEKMVFEALVRRGIYFIFQAEWSDVEQGADLPVLYEPLFKPDFVIPEYKVVIDPYSEFHHSLPNAVERDIQKRVLYDALDWYYSTPWSHEVEDHGGLWVVDSIPRLQGPPLLKLTKEKDIQAKAAQGYRIGPNLGAGAFSVGIANRMRRRAPQIGIRRGRSR